VGGRVQGQGSRGADHDEFFAPSVFELHAGDGKTWQKTMMNQGQHRIKGQKESNVTTMSQTTMSQQCHNNVTNNNVTNNNVTTMSQQCQNLTTMSQQCHNNVTTMSQTTMSQQCHNNVQKTTIKT
jgi:uncharacterized protein (DUF1800 family)